MSPAVWLSRCQTRIGSAAGTVCGTAGVPPRNTRTSANSGSQRLTGSLRPNAPSSNSCIATTEVIGLVIE